MIVHNWRDTVCLEGARRPGPWSRPVAMACVSSLGPELSGGLGLPSSISMVEV